MAWTLQALVYLLGVYTTLSNAAVYGRNATTITSSSTIGTAATSTGACMTVLPFSDISSSGSVVSTTYTATPITYTLTTTSASTVSCTYEGADPDQGKAGYCSCSGSTYSILTGTSGSLCAYTSLPNATAVITASPILTTTQNCYACTVYGEANENCVQISGCTPTSTTTVTTNTASTTTSSTQVTCTSWTQCPACPSGQSQGCFGLAGQESCVCLTDDTSKVRRGQGVAELREPNPVARRERYGISRVDNPLLKRADDGDAMNCPYEPPAEDTYCVYTGLSKRANDAKEITLPWVSNMKWSNYPQCPATGDNGITQVNKFYYPAGAALPQNQIQGYDPTVAQAASNNGLINGIAQSQFANDHVFEAQLISGFLSWLCGQPSITGYTQMPWPAGWTQPDSTWCAAVFGSDSNAGSGFLFPAYNGDANPNNFLGNSAEVTGGVTQPGLMAIYYGKSNGWKGKITKAQWPAFSGLSGTVQQQREQAGVVIRDTANVFSYLADATIEGAWTGPSKSIETVCVQFDNLFWGSTSDTNAPGTKLVRPAAPQGVTNWGLRTLWAYWVDNHLYKIEQQVPNWVTTALGKVGGANSGFALAYMQTPGGLATADQMHFPLDANNANAPIPGTQGSATSTASRYMMWDGATYGVLGL